MLFAAGNIVLVVIFWVLMLLAVIGALWPDSPNFPHLNRGRWIIVLILLAILGISQFGNPAN